MTETSSAVSSAIVANDDALLRSDVRRLADLLGQSLVRQEGQDLLDLVEAVRKAGRDSAEDVILAKISDDQAVDLVRAFSTFFHLANVAEQVHRSRIIAEARRGGFGACRTVRRDAKARGTCPRDCGGT